MKARQQSGFTLIELVMVIVILGILSAVAIPQFVDLSAEAEQGAVNGVAGALGSAAAINYASCKANSAAATCKTISNCTDADLPLLLQGGLPTEYTITAGASVPNCIVTHTLGKFATFQGLVTP